MDQNSITNHDNWQEQLDAAMQEAAKNHDKYLRALAESENVRKRMERLCEDRIWQEKKRLLIYLVELEDQLQDALQYADANDPLGAGIRLTHERLQKALGREGAKAVPAVGETFDPNIHEAVELADTGQGRPNEVTLEFRKGYLLDGRLLRPARVQVNREG